MQQLKGVKVVKKGTTDPFAVIRILNPQCRSRYHSNVKIMANIFTPLKVTFVMLFPNEGIGHYGIQLFKIIA
jgi:hypothetical protein